MTEIENKNFSLNKMIGDFDLYTHLKSNIKSTSDTCDIHEIKKINYCYSCRCSICETCIENNHENHIILCKSKIINQRISIIKSKFLEFDGKVNESLFKKVELSKEKLKQIVNSEFEKNIFYLNQLKEKRIHEIDLLFYMPSEESFRLSEIFLKSKEKIFEFLNKNNDFFSFEHTKDVNSFNFLQLNEVISGLDTVLLDYNQKYDDVCQEIQKSEEEFNQSLNDFSLNINKNINDSYESISKRLFELEDVYNKHRKVNQNISSMKGNSLKINKQISKKSQLSHTYSSKSKLQLHNDSISKLKKIDVSVNEKEKEKEREEYEKEYKTGLWNAYHKLNKDLFDSFNGKIAKLDEFISIIQKSIYDSYIKNGNLGEIEKMVKIYEEKNMKRVVFNKDNKRSKSKRTLISNSNSKSKRSLSEKKKNELQLDNDIGNLNHTLGENKEDEKDEIKSIKNLKIDNMFKPKLKTPKNEKVKINYLTTKSKIKKDISKLNETFHENQILIQKIKSEKDFTLQISTVHKYFSFSLLEFIRKNFYKAKNLSSLLILNSVDDIIPSFNNESIKVFEGTADVQLYDRQSRKIIKKTVNIDRKIFNSSVFMTGCRTCFFNNKLFISGGKDSSGDKKSFWVYDITNDKLEKLCEMENARSFHTMMYHESFKSIMVFGGENNDTCEMFDIYLNSWSSLPSLNYPRANIQIYFDKAGTFGYAICGIIGNITCSLYSDQIELIDFVDINQGWAIIEYNNKSSVDLKMNENKIFPLSDDTLVIYGASESRLINKVYCIFDLRTFILTKVNESELEQLKIKNLQSQKFLSDFKGNISTQTLISNIKK